MLSFYRKGSHDGENCLLNQINRPTFSDVFFNETSDSYGSQDGFKAPKVLEQSQSKLISNKKGLKTCQPPSLIDKKTWHGAEITICCTIYVPKVSWIYQSATHSMNNY